MRWPSPDLLRAARGCTCTLVAVLLLLASGPASPAGGAWTGVAAVEAVGFTVSDLDRAVSWYTEVLGFQPAGPVVEVAGDDYEALQGLFGLRSRTARLRLGAEEVLLTEYLAPEGRPVPVDSRSHDRWFQHVALITGDLDEAYAWLRRHRVRHASSGPQRLPDWNPQAGGIRAFYFKDPDGHVLEALQFPEGKGDPRWHRPGPRFLGIDHTALVVEDTERSLAFYRDLLGLRVVGGSENHGPEQEHLNNVRGARLRITTLASPRGPKVELLQYLDPGDGRPYPPDSRPNDLWHWHVRMAAPAATAAARLPEPQVPWVSDRVAEVDEAWGYRRGLLVRDPDGHCVEIGER